MKRISVVITAYNEEKYLPKCLEAILDQNFPKDNYEIVVVDNNSTDKTAEIAKGYGARVVREEKQGNTFALKKGLEEAEGEIIASTDSDTLVLPGWLLEIDKAFKDEKIVGATGPVKLRAKNKFFSFISEFFYKYFLLFNFLIGKPHFSGFNFAVRKKTLMAIGGIDERFTMSPDVDLGIRINKKGKIVFLDKMTVLTSVRRWKEEPLKAFNVYIKGYVWAAWLRKPPPVAQNMVR